MQENKLEQAIFTSKTKNKNTKKENERKLRITMILIFIICIVAILFVPIKEVHDDGGSISYTSLTYKIMDWNQTHGRVGKEVYWFPNNLKEYNELNTTTFMSGFVVRIEEDSVLLNNREFEEDIDNFRISKEDLVKNPNFEWEELVIDDQIDFGCLNPIQGEDGVWTSDVIYGFDWFQGLAYSKTPALLIEQDVFRVQLDGWVYKENGKIDELKNANKDIVPDGVTSVFGVEFDYIKNEDGTYSVLKDGRWVFVEYEDENQFNIEKIEEEKMIEDSMSGETSDIDANGNPKGEIVAIEIDPETGEIIQLDPNDIPELKEQIKDQEKTGENAEIEE